MGRHDKQIDPPTAEEAAVDAEADKTFNRFANTPYAFAVLAFGQFFAISLIVWLSSAVGETPNPAFSASNSGIAIFLGLYFLVMVGVRFPEGGTFVLYEMLWGCNTSMVTTIVGIALGRPMLVGAAITAVSIDQLCWYIDCISYAVRRKMVIGAASYMVKPDCSIVTRVTSLHHLWFMPLCFWTLRHFGGVPPYAFVPAFSLTAFLAFWCRIFTPKTVPLSAREQRALGMPFRTINVNVCYGFWADVPIGFLHACDDQPAIIYLLYLSVCGNLFLNGGPYLLWRSFSSLA